MKKNKQLIQTSEVIHCDSKQSEVVGLMSYLREKGQSPVDRMKRNFNYLTTIDSLIEDQFLKHGADFNGEHLFKMKSTIEADIKSLGMSLEYEILESELESLSIRKVLIKPRF